MSLIKNNCRLSSERSPDEGMQHKRLTLEIIQRHYNAYGAEGTYLAMPSNIVIMVNGVVRQVTQVYTMPKYMLEYAQNRAADMAASQRLAAAQSSDDVLAALGGAPFSFRRHRYLVQHSSLRRSSKRSLKHTEISFGEEARGSTRIL